MELFAKSLMQFKPLTARMLVNAAYPMNTQSFSTSDKPSSGKPKWDPNKYKKNNNYNNSDDSAGNAYNKSSSDYGNNSIYPNNNYGNKQYQNNKQYGDKTYQSNNQYGNQQYNNNGYNKKPYQKYGAKLDYQNNENTGADSDQQDVSQPIKYERTAQKSLFKKFYAKNYIVSRPNMILGVDVRPAVFELKQNKAGNQAHSYVPPKNGYICFHFIKVNESTEEIDQQSKQTFVLSISNVRQFLDLDPDFKYKRYKRANVDTEEVVSEESADKNEIYLSFQPSGGNKIMNLKVHETENRWFNLTYFEIVDEKDITNEMSIEISPGELKIMQILVRYSMPSLLGWNGALDPKVCGLFFKLQ